MEVRARVEMDAVQAELRKAHYEVPNAVRATLKAAAVETVQPAVRRLAPSVVRPNMVARSTSTRAYIGVAGPRMKDRIAGLLNFGGTVRSPIRPKGSKRAVTTPWGPKSVVYRGAGGVGGHKYGKPAQIKGKHFIEKGIAEALPAMEEAFRTNVTEAFGSLANDH